MDFGRLLGTKTEVVTVFGSVPTLPKSQSLTVAGGRHPSVNDAFAALFDVLRVTETTWTASAVPVVVDARVVTRAFVPAFAGLSTDATTVSFGAGLGDAEAESEGAGD